MQEPYLAMALNNAWANATIYRVITDLSAEEFAAPRPGFFGSLKATLNHIHTVDRYYLAALEQDDFDRAKSEQDAIADVRVLAAAQADADMRLALFCRALTPAMLDQTRVTRRPEGEFEEKVGPILLHLFQHQIHHKGQAHTMIADAGINPPQLDEFYLEYDRAPTAVAYFAG